MLKPPVIVDLTKAPTPENMGAWMREFRLVGRRCLGLPDDPLDSLTEDGITLRQAIAQTRERACADPASLTLGLPAISRRGSGSQTRVPAACPAEGLAVD
jgi:hypothetical protein